LADHILLVEDSPVIRRLVEVCLRGLPHRFATAADGPSGVESALNDPPALLILDIGLPGFDGWEVLRRIREQPQGTDVPVLILTAHATEEDRFLAGEGHADAFMTKPFDPEDLRIAAQDLLDGARPASSDSAIASRG
jgi:DNA-binding response OmpR family regulator